MDVLLAPHNDDEALFAAFTLLRHRPHVVVCLRSHKQGDNWPTRELETTRALRVLGDCTWEQWGLRDDRPDWAAMKAQIDQLAGQYDRCFAPFPRFGANGWSGLDPMPPDGVCQHDRVGAIARESFGDRFVGYLTYTKAGKDDHGVRVPYEPEWVAAKLEALLCYPSQMLRREIAPHFLRGLEEFYAEEAAP